LATFNPTLPEPSSQERAAPVKPSPEGIAYTVAPDGGDVKEKASVKASFAAIFDMDGTLIDNTPYHLKSWQALYKKYGKGDLSPEIYYTEISGVPIKDTLKRVFGDRFDEAGLKALQEEKDALYRKEYAPYVKAVAGLENFLAELSAAGVKMAMASSATTGDIDFILAHVPIRQYFEAIVDSTQAAKPKPNPDIFLKAADAMKAEYQRCVVFEDSLAGIKAANAAGMKVVGITTGHTASELKPVNLVINNFNDLTAQQLADIFDKDKHE
jgi:beta-phosphoglucomutase family hydrolase